MTTDARPLPALALRRREEDFVDAVWDVFVSLRLTIPIMICLAVACILGTFINPENTPLSEISAQIGNRWWFPIYMFFEANDLFRSWWFMFLLVALTLNLSACTIERLPRIFKIALRPDKVVSERLLRGIRHQSKILLPEGDAQLGAGRVAGLFRARGFTPEIYPGEKIPGGDAGAVYMFAERGRYSRFGVWTVHLSLFMILGGALVGRFTGEEGVINVPMDGGTFDYFFRKTPGGMAYREPLGFTVRVDDFRLKKYVNGSPRSFESDLAVEGTPSKVPGSLPGSPSEKPPDVLKKTILVGEPLEYRGWTIYQASYQAVPERDQAKLHILDKQTQKTFDLKVTRGHDLQLGSVTFRAVNYTPNLSSLGPAIKIEREEAGRKTSFWVMESYPDFDTDNRGDRFGLRFDGLQPFFFTGLQVAKDLGYPWWLAGCCVLFLGLGIAFYTSHRRLWAKVSADGTLTLAGVAHKNQAAFETVYEELAAALGGSFERQGTGVKVLTSEFVISASDLSGAPALEQAEIAFLGRSNVGKSSMINSLLRRRNLARVSNTPGRTRLLNFFEVEVETDAGKRRKISICDLPGYGYAKAPREEIARWKKMIERYLHERGNLRLAIALIDVRTGPTELDLELLTWLASLGRPAIPVVTKIDKLSKSQRLPALQTIGRALGHSGPPLAYSSETGEGWDAVWAAMLSGANLG